MGLGLELAALLLAAAPEAESAEGAGSQALEFFEARVRPVLARKCHPCHGPQRSRSHLRLDHISTVLKGGDRGPAVLPGSPEGSLLVQAISYRRADLKMPPRGKLPDEEIAALTEWVRRGAPWPAEPPPEEKTGPPEFDLQRRRREHWAFEPVRPETPPEVRDRSWPQDPLDRFVLAKLEAAGLRPASRADPRALLRRVHFDLTGLPPSPEEAEEFARDGSPQALARVADRLLASPRFGERWARHWMDLVRYAETLGHEFDYPIHNAYRYRDYLIRAFNADLPYDRLVMEHIAGDLLEEPRRHPTEGFNESVIATGFFWLGQKSHSPVDVRQHQAEVIENQIDVLCKAFLGLTVSCARCHDHKFDAISTRDYYALFGVLASSRYRQAAIDPPSPIASRVERLSKLKERIRVLLPEALREPPSPAPAGESAPEGPSPAPPAIVFADFLASGYAGWFADGPAFGSGPTRTPDFLVGTRPERPIEAIIPAGWAHSGLLSRRLQGALRSETFTIARRYLHVLAAGEESRINVVVDGYTLIRDPIYGRLKKVLSGGKPRWISFDLAMWQGHRAYLELSDIAAPDPADDGKKAGFRPDGFIAARRVVFSDQSAPPAEEAEPAWRELAGGWGEVGAELEALLEEYRAVEASIPEPAYTPAMADGNGLDERVFVRGSHKSLGQTAPRGFLEALSVPDDPGPGEGSGRLWLARRIADPSNPYFARVMVNRVFGHLFGQGLVASVDNFGALGERPSHRELLDWLAGEFTRDGYSLKRLLRRLVLSSAYQMSSRADDPAALEKDPEGVLLSRRRVRRLEGEAIRDSILALSGRLDPRMFGASVPVHLTSFLEGRGRPESSGPLDGAGRRSIYLEVRRNFLSPLMLAFDAPIPFTTVGRRTVSNVPAQALILLNDPFVEAQARAWGERVLGEARRTAERIERMYLSAFSRPPSRDELEESCRFLGRQAETYGLPPSAQDDPRPWADLGHVLWNVKGFIYLE